MRTYILNYMTMIANKEECACVNHVYLHADQAVCMAWQMVQRDALTKVKSLLIKSFPVAIKSQLSRVNSV